MDFSTNFSYFRKMQSKYFELFNAQNDQIIRLQGDRRILIRWSTIFAYFERLR